MQSPARQKNRQLVNSCFSFYSKELALLQGVDNSVTGGHYLPKMCKGHSESFKHAVIQFLKVLVECEAPQLVDYIESLSQTCPEQGEVPEEGVRGAGVRPCPHSAAEEAHSQEGEEVKMSVETASSHEAEEEQDVGEVEQRSLRSLLPFATERERWRRRLHCQVHGFKVRRLHRGGREERSSANTESAPT